MGTQNETGSKIKDITGCVFGELTVLEYLANSYWLCRCSCGEVIKVQGTRLRSGDKTSCGHGGNKLLIDLRVIAYLR